MFFDRFTTVKAWKSRDWIFEQIGRLAPIYFLQGHKYFDQHLPTVKNETIV